jgi:valyl-tRNA synthetase
MIMAGYEYEKEKPFSDVYFTGMVRDKQGRKMSKQLGNSPDLLELIDRYGADAVRFGIMISSPAGNDLLFDESALEQGRNFNNKMWNALKLVKSWEARIDPSATSTDTFAADWFENTLEEVSAQIDTLIQQFRLSEALKTIYSLIWDDFCSWYLEWIKPAFNASITKVDYDRTVQFYTRLLQLLHPFMPFVTEEIYHLLEYRDDDLCIRQFDKIKIGEQSILKEGRFLKEVITGLRDVRNKLQLKQKETINLYIQSTDQAIYKKIQPILSRQLNAKDISFMGESIANSTTTVIGKDKFFVATEKVTDTIGQKEDLLKELNHLKGFLISIEKKLGNEKFVLNAKPDVIALEQKKKSDAETKIRIIEESLATI